MATTNEAVLNQIRAEYEEGRSYLEPKKTRWTRQLMMMNNLQRGEQNIASTTLLSYFNRVFSALYSNTQSVKFVPGNDSELYASESLNKMALSDGQEMGKPMIDYDVTWDACFYGRGYYETIAWNERKKCMAPVAINPMFFSYDPYFANHQEWRYYDKWILKNKHTIERLITDGTIDLISNVKELETGVDPYIWTWHIQAELAKDVNPAGTDSIVPSSGIYQILEHYMYIDGVKHVVWTNRSVTKLLRKDKVDQIADAEVEGEYLWPIVPKTVFREPHSSATVSIPDLIEDKHRALNVLFNLAYIAAKDEVNPIYEYVPEKLKNPSQLFQRQINQHIPVTELGAIQPVKQKAALSSSALAFISTMKSEAADVIGSAQPAAIGMKGKKSATQDAILQQIADLAQSLQAKLMANGEAEFWAHWYQSYLKHKKEGDYKMITLTDARGTSFEQIELDKIKTTFPPKIIIMSSKEAEYKEMVERREIAGQMKLLEGVMGPAEFRLFLKNIYFPKFKTFDQSSIDLAFPKTIAEIQAEQENDALSKGQWVDVQESDDHEVHLYIHMRAKHTAETWTHIQTHQYALGQQQKAAEDAAKNGPAAATAEGQPDQTTTEGSGGPDKQPQGSGTKKQPSKTTPAEAAVPSSMQRSPLQPAA